MPNGVARIPEPFEWVRTKRCPACGETKPWALYSPRYYWPDGMVRTVSSHCRKCKGTAPAQRQAHARFRERNRDQRNAIRRAERVHQRQEMSKALTGHRLLVGPFREWLRAHMAAGGEITTLADLAGCSARVIRRVLNGHQEFVALHTVDCCLTAMGEHIDSLYPIELAEAA